MSEYKKIVFENNESKVVRVKNLNPCSVEVFYSGINYKDALGVTGRGDIFKKTPIVPGIDFSGVALKGIYKGKKVIAQGSGFGESFDGGYTQYSKSTDEHLLELPKGLTLKESMVLGTAGFTAALAIYRMLKNDQNPDMGPVLVSGATGGVGSFAIQILCSLGFEVTAFTHRIKHKEYLLALGAHSVITQDEIYSGNTRVLSKSKWGGVIDNLGGVFLERVLPQVSPWGSVASIGIAKGPHFSSTVIPFILRGVSIIGVSSTNCKKSLRESIWKKLGSDWKPKKIESLVTASLSLEEVLDSAHKILDHKGGTGRVLVDLKK